MTITLHMCSTLSERNAAVCEIAGVIGNNFKAGKNDALERFLHTNIFR